MPQRSASDPWRPLRARRDDMAGRRLADLHDADPRRAERYAVDLGDLYFDYSRQRIDDGARRALLDLADAAGLADFLARMAAGDTLNATEGRAVLHTACRGTEAPAAIAAEVAAADTALEEFVRGVHAGTVRSVSGAPFAAVVAIGIGGSELGPALAIDALRDTGTKLDVRVCGNIDGIALARAFAGLDPAETLVVVVSKSFTTLETAANGARAKARMQKALGERWAEHFAVVSANLEATGAFGVADERVFPMWDWVGGRYSLWSAVGLPVALAFGWDAFADLRRGGREIDAHALSAPAETNVPFLMALLTVWNASILGYGAEAVVPYDTRLKLLVDHLQQLEMESNGKRVTVAGETVEVATQPVVFGGVGTNAQHAFFQQLHQGTVAAPVDILVPATPPTGDPALHEMLIANAFAQADALAFGQANAAEPHRHYPGDRPSSVLIYRDLDAAMLGRLIALYEHKTAAAGALWGINSFDQWGVELGKKLSEGIGPMLAGAETPPPSLAPLIAALGRMRPGG